MVKKTKKTIQRKTKKVQAGKPKKAISVKIKKTVPAKIKKTDPVRIDKTRIVKKCIKLVEAFSEDETAFEKILHPKVESTVYPNLFALKIHIRKLEEMKAGMKMGQKILKSQEFKIKKTFETADAVIVEVLWTGEIAVDASNLKKGQLLKADCCFVFEFKDGKIFRQRNYDCYEQFENDPAHLAKSYERMPDNKPFLTTN